MRPGAIYALLVAVAAAALAQAGARKPPEVAAAPVRPHALALEACVEAVPGPVRGLKVRASKQSLTVQWQEPAGDACLDHFDLQLVEKPPSARTRGAGAVPPPAPTPVVVRSDGFSMTLDSLKPQQEYEVRVYAVNAQKGRGPHASATARTRASRDCEARVPAPVTDFNANQVGAALRLSWLPSDAGGCPTSYQVEAFDAAGRRVLSLGTLRPQAALAGVQGASKYTFVITPSNRAGAGGTTRVTVSTRALCGAGGAPGAVTGLTAKAPGADGRVQLAWGAPAGGACVQRYLVSQAPQANESNAKAVTPASPGSGASIVYQMEPGTSGLLYVTPVAASGRQGAPTPVWAAAAAPAPAAAPARGPAATPAREPAAAAGTAQAGR